MLEAGFVAGPNVVVAVGTYAGSPTKLNRLGSTVTGRERIVSVEEVFELKFDHPDRVPMQTRRPLSRGGHRAFRGADPNPLGA